MLFQWGEVVPTTGKVIPTVPAPDWNCWNGIWKELWNFEKNPPPGRRVSNQVKSTTYSFGKNSFGIFDPNLYEIQKFSPTALKRMNFSLLAFQNRRSITESSRLRTKYISNDYKKNKFMYFIQNFYGTNLILSNGKLKILKSFSKLFSFISSNLKSCSVKYWASLNTFLRNLVMSGLESISFSIFSKMSRITASSNLEFNNF